MAIDDPSLVHLRAAGVSVVLDLTGARLPEILHWGADLGDLTAQDALAIAEVSVRPVPPNAADVPLRVAILPEGAAGWLGRPGLSGHREGRAWSPRFGVVEALLDGTPLDADGGLTTADGGGVLQVAATDEDFGLRLDLTVELLPTGLVRSRATVTNQQESPYTIDDLVLTYPVPSTARTLLDLAGRWGKEKTPQRSRLEVGTHLRENRRGRTGADAAGVLHLGEDGFDFADGRIWAVHTAWSGNHVHYAERVNSGVQVVGGGELLLPGEVVLGAGESYSGPWIYGAHGLGLDAVARRFHRHLRSRETPVNTARPVTLNVWEAVYFDHDLHRLLRLTDLAAQVGVERLVLDDGWFGARRHDYAGLGDWVVSSDVWPDGLHPLVDAVTAAGMQFGLWFEPEMVNPDSDVARAHPEWIMSARPDSGQAGWPIESRHQQVLNIAIPECYAHVRDQMDALLREYDISYIKWDHNRDLIDSGDATRGGAAGVHAQTLAYYRLVEELKERHPGLEIESCSSGGARVDLEVMSRCDRVWVSDCIDPLERQQMNRWTMQLLPPEMMGSHIASGRSHTTGREHSLSFRAGTALLGHLGIEWDLEKATTEEISELQAWIAYYKEHRDHLLSGDLVRVDVADPDTLSLYGVVSPGRERATYFQALTARADTSPRPRLRLPGLDPERRYAVRPVVVGDHPHGLAAPRWWDPAAHDGERAEPHLDPADPYPATDFSRRRFEGTVLPGVVLAEVGVQAPLLNPDQIVMIEVTAI